MNDRKLKRFLDSMNMGISDWFDKLSDTNKFEKIEEFSKTTWDAPDVTTDSLWAAEADDVKYHPDDDDNFVDVSEEYSSKFIPVIGGYRGYIKENISEIGMERLLNLWGYEIDEYFAEVGGLDEHQVDVLIEGNLLTILGEKTYKDLRIDAPNFLRIRDKSKQTPGSRFQTIDENNICHFKTPSHTHPGVTYDQQVKLLALEELMQTQSGIKKPVEIVKMALESDIEVHCTDPSWKYWGFQYIGTKKHYAVEPEPRYPKIRNPNLKGSVCKHLDNVLFILPFQSGKIVHELKSQQRL